MKTDALQTLLETVVRSLVDTPDAIIVTRIESSLSVKFYIQASGGELGQVIGKQGRIGNAVRTIIKSVARKDSEKAIYIDIGGHSGDGNFLV